MWCYVDLVLEEDFTGCGLVEVLDPATSLDKFDFSRNDGAREEGRELPKRASSNGASSSLPSSANLHQLSPTSMDRISFQEQARKRLVDELMMRVMLCLPPVAFESFSKAIIAISATASPRSSSSALSLLAQWRTVVTVLKHQPDIFQHLFSLCTPGDFRVVLRLASQANSLEPCRPLSFVHPSGQHFDFELAEQADPPEHEKGRGARFFRGISRPDQTSTEYFNLPLPSVRCSLNVVKGNVAVTRAWIDLPRLCSLIEPVQHDPTTSRRWIETDLEPYLDDLQTLLPLVSCLSCKEKLGSSYSLSDERTLRCSKCETTFDPSFLFVHLLATNSLCPASEAFSPSDGPLLLQMKTSVQERLWPLEQLYSLPMKPAESHDRVGASVDWLVEPGLTSRSQDMTILLSLIPSGQVVAKEAQDLLVHFERFLNPFTRQIECFVQLETLERITSILLACIYSSSISESIRTLVQPPGFASRTSWPPRSVTTVASSSCLEDFCSSGISGNPNLLISVRDLWAALGLRIFGTDGTQDFNVMNVASPCKGVAGLMVCVEVS